MFGRHLASNRSSRYRDEGCHAGCHAIAQIEAPRRLEALPNCSIFEEIARASYGHASVRADALSLWLIVKLRFP
jgi:hypothetical protein